VAQRFRPWCARPGSDGAIVEYIGTSMDVTEQRQSERRLRVFFESDMMGAIYWNMDGAITDANDKFLQMVRSSREDLTAVLLVEDNDQNRYLARYILEDAGMSVVCNCGRGVRITRSGALPSDRPWWLDARELRRRQERRL
jgi:PAS domain-containing protein